MPFLTVFTPTYNRAYTLSRTYRSLLDQSFKDFIWLIIDDGSTDNTRELVKGWQSAENGFEIRYIYKQNGGMHSAHNTAYSNIDTELNVCIDSDDAIAEDAVLKIYQHWEMVKEHGYAGLIGLDADMSTGRVIGRGFPNGLNETTLHDYYFNGGSGDKKLVYRTDIIKRYPPYPIFPGEKFVPLGCLYSWIDRDYKLAVLDDVLCKVEYMADGSTRNMFRQYAKNPRGFAYSRIISMKERQRITRLFVICTHYVAESILGKNKHFLSESPRKIFTLLSLPTGLAMAAYIKWRVKDG